MPLLTTGAGKYPVAGAATTTLDPADKQNATLSGGNLIATGVSFAQGIAHAIATASSGKFYCEFTAGQVNNTAVGVMTSGHTVNDFMGNASGTAAVGYGGAWQGNVGGTTTSTTIINGRTYGLAIDVTNRTAWLKDFTTPGNWNANGTADPATNTNGATLGGPLAAGALVVAVSVNDTNDVITFNFGATAYTGTPPSGFGNW